MNRTNRYIRKGWRILQPLFIFILYIQFGASIIFGLNAITIIGGIIACLLLTYWVVCYIFGWRRVAVTIWEKLQDVIARTPAEEEAIEDDEDISDAEAPSRG